MGSSLEALETLAARRRFGIKPGLDTITRLCAALWDPQKKLRGVIHIAGTNGKGAVAAILDACLRQSAMDDGVCPRDDGVCPRVGRYTSPHLVKLNERFFLNGAPIDDATLEAVADKVSAAIDHSDLLAQDSNAPTFFEALTAVAFSLYAETNPDYVILETGLGGRLDATNICEPSLTIITRIGLDHCAWLGDSVEKIAAEKAGIIKPGVPVVLGCNEEAVQAVIKARAKEVGAPYYYAPDLASASEIPADFPLCGTFNRENALTALAALKVLSRNSGFPILDSSFFILHSSFLQWPGRFQKVRNFLIDGAHNPPGARALVAAIKEEYGEGARMDLVFGACADKEVGEVLQILRPIVRKAYAVRTNNPRSLAAGDLAALMGANALKATDQSDSLRDLLPKLEPDVPTLICGSLFLVGEALVELGAYPWGEVRYDASESPGPATSGMHRCGTF